MADLGGALNCVVPLLQTMCHCGSLQPRGHRVPVSHPTGHTEHPPLQEHPPLLGLQVLQSPETVF